MGFWDRDTQQAIIESRVSVAGTGGAGYLYALELAHLGVQKFTIADPDTFDYTNIGRVLGATEETVGRNKAEVLAEEIRKVNSQADVRIYKEGVSVDNLEDFYYDTDIALDATELSLPELGTMICRHGRNRVVNGEHKPFPVLNTEYVAHAGQVTSFVLGSIAFEDFMGIKGGVHAPLDEVAGQVLSPSRYLAYIPPYGDIATLRAIEAGAPLPSNMIGAGTAAQLGIAETVKHIRRQHNIKSQPPTIAPTVRWYDPYINRAGETSHPRVSYYRHLGVTAFNNFTGRFEPGDYSIAQRAERGDIG